MENMVFFFYINWVEEVCKSDYYYKKYLQAKYPQAMFGLYFTSLNMAYNNFGMIWNHDGEEELLNNFWKRYSKKNGYPPTDYNSYSNYYNKIYFRLDNFNIRTKKKIFCSINNKLYFYGIKFRQTHTQISPSVISILSRGTWADQLTY